MPYGLGAVISRKCYVAVSENATQADIDAVFPKCQTGEYSRAARVEMDDIGL